MTETSEDPSEYGEVTEDLESFGRAMQGLIAEALRAAGLNVHSVNYRVKTADSAARKLTRGEDKYSGFRDLKDLLGLRVITYFPDEVDKVADVLKPEFVFDEENSVDKRTILDADRFGYMSLHFVGELNAKRTKLTEYQRYAGRCFELQIRSILQHAWAEIEHDLGYKAEGSLPRDVRRRFSRLAGLLELADDEFSRLRSDLNAYEKRVKVAMKQVPASLSLDQSTLTEYLSSPEVRALDAAVAKHFPADVASDIDTAYAAKMARDLAVLGVRDMSMLAQLVSQREKHVEEFARYWLGERDGRPRREPLLPGIGLFYLAYTLVATADDATMEQWARRRRPSKPSGQPDILARVHQTWTKVVSVLGEPPDSAVVKA